MKKSLLAMLSFAFVAAPYGAQAQNSPVTIMPDSATSKTTTVVTDAETGETKVTIEEEPAFYDAVSGEPVSSADKTDDQEGEQSLRDKVRSKMDHVDE